MELYSINWKCCRCPKWINGLLDGGFIRKSAKTRSWEKAEELKRTWEEAASLKKIEPVTIEEAVDAYLADAKARELRDSTLYKLRIIFQKQGHRSAFSEGNRSSPASGLPRHLGRRGHGEKEKAGTSDRLLLVLRPSRLVGNESNSRAGKDLSGSNAEEHLKLAAHFGRLALIFDGWNELDAGSRKRANAEIKKLKRESHDLSIVLSTRRQALDVGLSGPVVEIAPLSDTQQLTLARALRYSQGESILDHAWRTSGIRDLGAIPLYLTALVAYAPSESLPTTKEEVLRLLSRNMNARPRKPKPFARRYSDAIRRYSVPWPWQ